MSQKLLIKKLDDVFSLYVRQKYANEKGIAKCYTCSNWYHWKEMDAGHYIPRIHMGTRWDLINVRPQCQDCNRFNYGKDKEFKEGLIKEHGENIIDQLTLKKHSIAIFRKPDLLFMILDFNQLLNNLK